MTIELFMVQDSHGETPLHVAARKGTLNQVPAEFLTPETLSVMESYGRTPLHLAAKYNCLNQIPKHVLTPDLLGIAQRGAGVLRKGHDDNLAEIA